MEITVPAADLLDAAEERELAESIELGVYARHLLGSDAEGGTAAGRAELERLATEGDRAWERFLLANVRLVSMVSRASARTHQLSESDLFQEGFAGMACALQRFDHHQPCRFATYALPWIRNHVAAAVRTRSGQSIGRTRSTDRLLAEVRRAWRELAQRHRREPTSTEVAAHIGAPVAEVALALSGSRCVPLLEEASAETADHRCEELIEAVLDEQVRPQLAPVRSWLASLPVLDARVLALRFGFGGPAHSYAGIGRTLQLHPTSVRRIETRALTRLRELCRTDAMLLAG